MSNQHSSLIATLMLLVSAAGCHAAQPPGPELTVTMTPAHETFAPGQPLVFRYAFTNTSDKSEFAIYSTLFDYQYSDDRTFDAAASIQITQIASGKVWKVACHAEILRKRSNFPTVTLAPGKSHVGVLEFENHLRFVAGNQKPLEHLPAGKYRLEMTWSFPKVENSKVRWRVGPVTAAPVEFQIADKPAQKVSAP